MVLGNIQRLALGAGLVALLAVGAFAGWQTYQVSRQQTHIVQLEHSVKKLTDNVRSLERQAVANEAANQILADRLEQQRGENVQLQIDLENIYNVPDEFDGPIAPILRNYLDGIAR